MEVRTIPLLAVAVLGLAAGVGLLLVKADAASLGWLPRPWRWLYGRRWGRVLASCICLVLAFLSVALALGLVE